MRLRNEALYYAWKLGTMGILPAILTGQGLVGSGERSVLVVKDKLKSMALLRAGYSLACWAIGIAAFAGTVLMSVVFDDLVPKESNLYGSTIVIYYWAAVPLLVATGLIQLILRPIYVISICEIYSHWIAERHETVVLPDDPSKGLSAFVAFAVLCFLIGIAYLHKY